MAYARRSYVEHVAVRVRDIRWHIRFFREALGMEIREVDGSPDDPNQVWLTGGVQLMADAGFVGPEGRLGHLGVMTEDLEAALEDVYQWGVRELPQGRNWVELPDGLSIELIQASGGAVEAALAVSRRAPSSIDRTD
jgi:catechol 2,3-dioxygenase-like lactoylglutathione lyase family enzyme